MATQGNIFGSGLSMTEGFTNIAQPPIEQLQPVASSGPVISNQPILSTVSTNNNKTILLVGGAILLIFLIASR